MTKLICLIRCSCGCGRVCGRPIAGDDPACEIHMQKLAEILAKRFAEEESRELRCGLGGGVG